MNAVSTLYGGNQSRITTLDLQKAKQQGDIWPMLTCYDALTAKLFDDSGIPVLLVGDSAAMVMLGYDSTVPITVDELLVMVKAVTRSAKRALVVADLPFGSYQAGITDALTNATRMIKEGGATAVKLEGGTRIAPQVAALVEAGIPVMGHLGLTPQSVNVFGGYKVQGKGDDAEKLIEDALALQAAGAFSIVLEVIPAQLAKEVTAKLRIPTIGIGAGSGVDAQVLVWQDLMGLTADPAPRFVKRYFNLRDEMKSAVDRFATEVKTKKYPETKHSY
ncbi:MAG: 3-methyl-2-oxobutanoate hydroxymethyltransferase [Actinobacteria bacterium]|jgi:3-methyl-2-oxobutanoate hydroxymethyltransferase|uniref:3-methyl-2-oxobutanoate hydroxymethyltransferase n=1 Tax=freshwater metagenome TaxID=449393 RepID=A0A6J6EUP0_9ZZZZ|nr:3-methyl-2-oxobutanoate hydroxymethyltransferase [Actinomycetota bacterium]